MKCLVGEAPPIIIFLIIIIFWLTVLSRRGLYGEQLSIASLFPIIISAVFWKIFIVLFVLFLIFLACDEVVYRVRTNYPNNNWTNNPAPQSVPTVPQYPLQANQYYHGTSYSNAMEIYNDNLWMIGDSTPPAVWMTDNITVARGYSNSNGAIVVVNVNPGTNLQNLGSGVYIYEVPGAQPYKEYYKIPNLTPVAVLNYQGNKIR